MRAEGWDQSQGEGPEKAGAASAGAQLWTTTKLALRGKDQVKSRQNTASLRRREMSGQT